MCEEDWPWANTCCQPSSFCMEDCRWASIGANLPLFYVDTATAWLDKWCEVHGWDPNQQTPGCQSRAHKLNHYTTGPAPLMSSFQLTNSTYLPVSIRSSFSFWTWISIWPSGIWDMSVVIKIIQWDMGRIGILLQNNWLYDLQMN